MNVLYVTVDALRADHVTPELMPNVSDFVDNSIEYKRCYANGPGTPWSFPALLASRYSGANDGFGIPAEDDPRPTLAEVFQDEGYDTAGFTDNRFASSDYNYDRGMETMFDAGATSSEKRLKQAVRERLNQDGFLYQTLLRAHHLIDDVLVNIQGRDTRFVRAEVLIEQLTEWVNERENEWFAWLHPMDTHAPYEAPDDYQEEFLDEPVPRRRSQELARKATHHPDELSDSDWELQQRLYKAECRYFDDQFSRLLDSIPKSERENTLIVFTADHGEMHGEHGRGGHPQEFWEEVIHVPCAVSTPAREQATVEEQVGLVDLPPTILEPLDIEPPDGWVGDQKIPKGDRSVEDRANVFVDVGAELDRSHAGLRRADDWKLVRHQDDEYLLDLSENPAEDPAKDRTKTHTEIHDELTAELDRHLDEMERRREGDLVGVEDEEVIEDHLKELGYLE